MSLEPSGCGGAEPVPLSPRDPGDDRGNGGDGRAARAHAPGRRQALSTRAIQWPRLPAAWAIPTRKASPDFTAQYGLTPAAFRKRGAATSPLLLHERKGQQMFDVDIRREPARRPRRPAAPGPLYRDRPQFRELGTILSGRGLKDQMDGLVGVYYDDPGSVPARDLRSHAGAILPEGMAAPRASTRSPSPSAASPSCVPAAIMPDCNRPMTISSAPGSPGRARIPATRPPSMSTSTPPPTRPPMTS